MASLTWKVKKIEDSCGNSNPSWISVSPSTGTSSVNPNITVSEATSPDDCSDGYVVLSASTGDETIIPVSRCLPDCNCIKAAFASTIDGTEYGENYEGTVTAGTYNTNACGTIGVIVGGTIFDRSSVSVSNGKITIKVTANTSYDKRYDFFRFTLNGKTCFSGSISQAAKVNPCYTSTTVSVTPTTITDETCAGTSATYSLTGTGNECWFVKKAKITPNDLAIINLDSSEITVTPNPSYEPRVGTCVLTMQNGTNGIEVQSTINITQVACESPASCSDVVWIGDDECITCDCNADDFELSTTSIEVPIDGYDDEVIGSVNTCIDKTNMTVTESSSTPWGVILKYSDNDNNIYLTVPANEGAARNETITIAYSATCGSDVWEKEISLSQTGESVTCGCNSITYEGTEEPDPTPGPPMITINLALHNGGSSTLSIGVVEIFTTMGSVQVPVNDNVSGRATKTVVVSNYSGYEGNTVTQVNCMVNNQSKCFSFTCSTFGGCDLGEGDTLTVELNNEVQCTN